MTAFRRTLMALVTLVLVFSASASAADAPDEKTRFEYALSLYMQGAYDSAVKEFKDYVKDYPKGEYSDDAYYWLGKYYTGNGGFDEGLEQFKGIISILPSGDKAPDAQYETASYWFNPGNPKHDYEKAVAEFTKLPFFYPDSPLVDDAAYYAAVSLVKLRNYAKAEGELKAFIERYPRSEFAAPAAYQLGLAYALQGKTDDALAAFQSVRDNHPAGLYRQEALDAVELITKRRDKKPLALAYAYGTKGNAPGMLAKPVDAALDGQGALYVSDSGNGRVQRLRLSPGALSLDTPRVAQSSLEKSLQPARPAGLAVGPDGRLFMADSSLHRVQVFQPDGRLVLTVGRKGQEAEEMSNPAGVAVDEGGNLYVADSGNRRVSKFDNKGRFVKSIGSSGVSEDNLLKSPVGVAIDVEGNLLVCDNSTDRVYKYDPAGKLVMLYGDKAEPRYRLTDPAGIAVDRLGNVYVVDRGGPSILILNKDLAPVMSFPGEGGRKVLDDPAGLAVSGSGELFVADQGLNQILVIK